MSPELSFREVVVTGIGPVLAGCCRRETFWDQVHLGQSQLVFEPDPRGGGRRCAMGRVRDEHLAELLDEIPERFRAVYPREIRLYLASLISARDDAGLDLRDLAKDRIGLFDGSARMNFAFWYDRIQQEVSRPPTDLYTRRELMTGLPGQTVGIAASLFKIRGPTHAFAATCSAGAVAIGHAYREIALGEIDLAFATGHDSCLIAPMYAMYDDARLLTQETEDARRAVRPYVGHSTNAFGEGAVTLALEAREVAERRGATILARLVGFKHGNNGYHPTTVDVAGVRPAAILEELVKRHGVPLDAIGFVLGHGNGVQLSDVSELNYMRLVFGARAPEVPLISTKPIYGHTLGASSAVNAAAAALMLHHDYVIPTINVDAARQKRSARHQPNEGVARRSAYGLSMTYGMGGHNAALLFGRNEAT